MKKRDDIPCGWAAASDTLYRSYHDQEWGVPERDSRALWAKFQLDAHQAGLSWITILRKRETMREEFDGFDPESVARWSQKRIDRAMKNPGVIRSPMKIAATINNAQVYLDMAEKGEDFSDYVWSFVDHKPIVNKLDHWRNVQAKTPLSEVIAKDMKKRGFKFCGPVIVYAVMQAMGMVNDHEVRCPRHKEIQKLEKARRT
ncbi:MAG: DNA-3-methyladenine glycosylase [Alphaproteobacteria bacterium 32-64-14]|nr:MAG: DNA-3-methyladenine glycosylase [Alphaproteobacteria bacterium 32-64-14]